MNIKNLNVALIGNPNVGKTSVFNKLTGLNQQVGNYPGITVDRKIGFCKLPNHYSANIIDLPGTYSLNASSLDESIVIEYLFNKTDKLYADVVLVISDVENLKRNLLLFTQIKDLEIPTILVINMADRMEKKGIVLDIPLLEKELKTKIVLASSRQGVGIDEIKMAITQCASLSKEPCLDVLDIDPEYFGKLKTTFPKQSLYKLWLIISQDVALQDLKKHEITGSFAKPAPEIKRMQQKETIKRYQFINNALKEGLHIKPELATDIRAKLDHWATHKVCGYCIFVLILFAIFQSIFEWSEVPMNFIDTHFTLLSTYLKGVMPAGMLTNLISEGIVPGIGGILIFIPQIAFLFLFISVLEESGYMSRVVFLMDRIMRRFGLSGKSVIPLISGTACAIPAIMATRNIENWRERLITILATPFVTCAARLPVYTIIIGLIIPNTRLFGFMNLQALTLTCLYLLGFGMAFVSAFILNKILKNNTKSFFIIEMPNYKLPLLKNVFITVVEKTKAFVYQAGKIILAISIILWFLASYGPTIMPDSSAVDSTQIAVVDKATNKELHYTKPAASEKLEDSYIGIMGKTIEPVISPMGYDWKIGIAILSSFAAREVFIGTLATIYSVGGEDSQTVVASMSADINPHTGQKVFGFATGISLLLYYAFAMQCISTIAVTKKETNSWKWSMLQLFFMGIFTYIVTIVAYQALR